MNVAGGLPGAFEPQTWFLAFFETTSRAWLDRIAPGRFKHVSAFAYVPGARVWVWYDAHWMGSSLVFLPHDGFIGSIGPLTKGATIVKFSKRPAAPMPFSTRVGFYCVPAIKHLINLRCVAVFPDQFYRSVIRAGGILVSERQHTANSARPDAAYGGAAGAE